MNENQLAITNNNHPVVKCLCGLKTVDDCPGEWEQGCDLGANEKYVEVYTQYVPQHDFHADVMNNIPEL